jgi:glycosyltransferase involved in cell wall biosynthesis
VLNVLQIWKTDYLHGGGGAIAMHRLHTGLRDAGINSKILCMRKTTDSPHSIQYSPNKILKKIESRLKRIALKQGLNDIHFLNSFLLGRIPAYQKADVINIHGTHGFLNYLALPVLSRYKPIVYTLHDMWPYTGHCGFSFDCERWITGCGQCPYPQTHPAIEKDNTHLEWQIKNKVYRLSRLKFVTLSTMKTQEVLKSMLNRFPIYHIPNGLDVEVFYPLDSDQCRRKLGLSQNKKVLMFAALTLDQPRKGSDLLIKALQNLPEALKSNTILLTIGHSDSSIGERAGIQSINLGFIRDDHQKVVAYSAADIFISPSRGETLPLVLQESAACGTPMISFDVGGVADILQPGFSGYLAKPESAEDLSKGIVTLLENDSLRAKMSQNARKIIIKEFTLEMQVKRYIALYQDCLRKR